MRWLLDTCTVTEFTYPRPHPGVLAWLHEHHHDCAIAAASFAEIQYGIACLPHGARRNRLDAWAHELGRQFSGRVLHADDAVWRRFGELKASLRSIGRMQDALDMAIAATALRHGLPLVTRNTRHFEDTGLRLVNPWAAPPTA
ncbi:MAG: PIN domain-containing protein [Pseudorhodoferax sp.]